MSKYRTAESVSPQHPDKLCDRLSDAILDEYLRHDSEARTAVEVVGGHGKLYITGEINSTFHPDLEPVIRKIVGNNIKLDINLVRQSSEIAQGVDTGGAGDQGIMVGYATDETSERLPLEVVLARDLNQCLYKIWPYDGKTQVTLRGTEIVQIVASFQNAPHDELESKVKEWLATIDSNHSDTQRRLQGEERQASPNISLHVNPAGDWQVGGFDADTGLTGRKLVVDNYGPRIPIGGGCFSGKDATKVDRSAAYMARKIALDYLEKFQAHEVFTRLAYAIGYEQPLEASVIIDGRSEIITGYDLSPRGISDFLALRRPQYEVTAEYGHFGHSDFAWER